MALIEFKNSKAEKPKKFERQKNSISWSREGQNEVAAKTASELESLKRNTFVNSTRIELQSGDSLGAIMYAFNRAEKARVKSEIAKWEEGGKKGDKPKEQFEFGYGSLVNICGSNGRTFKNEKGELLRVPLHKINKVFPGQKVTIFDYKANGGVMLDFVAAPGQDEEMRKMWDSKKVPEKKKEVKKEKDPEPQAPTTVPSTTTTSSTTTTTTVAPTTSTTTTTQPPEELEATPVAPSETEVLGIDELVAELKNDEVDRPEIQSLLTDLKKIPIFDFINYERSNITATISRIDNYPGKTITNEGETVTVKAPDFTYKINMEGVSYKTPNGTSYPLAPFGLIVTLNEGKKYDKTYLYNGNNEFLVYAGRHTDAASLYQAALQRAAGKLIEKN